MIAVDSSTLIAFLKGEPGPDVDLLRQALIDRRAALPPPALTEVLSNVKTRDAIRRELAVFATLPFAAAAWERAAILRGDVLALGLKSRLADVLIAQCCIDADVPLLTRDKDFRHYVPSGLRLA